MHVLMMPRAVGPSARHALDAGGSSRWIAMMTGEETEHLLGEMAHIHMIMKQCILHCLSSWIAPSACKKCSATASSEHAFSGTRCFGPLDRILEHLPLHDIIDTVLSNNCFQGSVDAV